jgi:hypothetical protein
LRTLAVVKPSTWSLALSVMLVACGDPPPPPEPLVLPPLPPEAVLVAPRAISASVAFDLVDSAEGAVLAWGASATQGAGLRVIGLDPQGSPRGTDVDVIDEPGGDPVIEEISLARSGATVGVSWVERGPTPRIRAALTAGDVDGFGDPHDLGATEPADIAHPTRGRALLSTIADGVLIASHRTPDAPCASTLGATCAHVSRTRLSSPSEAARREDAMEVLSPCDTLLAGAIATGGTWFYGVCQANPQPVTTIYAIRPALSFAAATPMLESCTAEGMIALDERALVIGRCGGAMQLNVMDETGSITQHADAFTSAIQCVDGRPNITLTGAGTRIEIPLRGPRSGLAAALPSNIGPAGARAVWTGSALLVASQMRSDVVVHRFACREGEFIRTDS